MCTCRDLSLIKQGRKIIETGNFEFLALSWLVI